MNILAPISWLKEFCTTDFTTAELARELSLRSMSVDQILTMGDFTNMVVGEIEEVLAHPGADRLRIVMVDIGERVVQIVCGGSNLAVGARVAVALPGGKVKWHGEGEYIALTATKIRGEESYGMICAPAELGLEKLQGNEHEIWDISNLTSVVAGTNLGEALGLNEEVLEIEVTSNRPDAMSMLGLARELAVVTDGKFMGSGLRSDILRAGAMGEVSVIAPAKLCSSYYLAKLTGIKVQPSPWWLQKRLLQAGHRPINNIVDVTNYVLHELGQPLHAFDAQKINGALTVRPAVKGETFQALDKKTYQLSKNNLVIADDDGVLALGGVMGGLESGISDSTTEIYLESATFDQVNIRKTAREHNLFSDSQSLFEKGLEPEGAKAGLNRAIKLLQEIAGAKLVAVQVGVQQAEGEKKIIPIKYKEICKQLGVEIAEDQIDGYLKSLGFVVEKSGQQSKAVVPYWRRKDVTAPVDLSEEVARIYGYHNLPSRLPVGRLTGRETNRTLVWEQWLKEQLAKFGLTEFFSPSLTDLITIEKAGIDPKTAVRLQNPLNLDLEYLRPALWPGVLRDWENNQNRYSEAQVFELARTHLDQGDDNLPLEEMKLCLGWMGAGRIEQAWREIQGVMRAWGERAGVEFRYGDFVTDQSGDHDQSVDQTTGQQEVWFREKNQGEWQLAGLVQIIDGELKTRFGLVKTALILEINLESIFAVAKQGYNYQPLPTYPMAVRDITVDMGPEVVYRQLDERIRSIKNELLKKSDLIDSYRGKLRESGLVSWTFRLTIGADDRTLTADEINEVVRVVETGLTKV